MYVARLMHRGLLNLLLFIPCVLFLMSPFANGADNEKLTFVIDNIRRNESLYRNMEIHLSSDYLDTRSLELQSRLERGGQDPQDTSMIHSQRRRTRDVKQGDYFRVDVTGEVDSDSHAYAEDWKSMFDGERTKVLQLNSGHDTPGSATGFDILGRSDSVEAIWPHMLLFRQMAIHAPLSVLVSGGSTYAAHPLGNQDSRLLVESEYVGEVEFNGLICHKIYVTTSVVGFEGWHDRWELWLAEERNFIPVRMFSYMGGLGGDIPVAEGSVADFMEVSPGLWFPTHANVAKYDLRELQKTRTQVEAWRSDYVIDKVQVDPKYPRKFFQELVFPRGTSVYVQGPAGNITDSYLVGAPGDQVAGASVSSSWYWVIGANAVGLLVLGVFAARRWL